MEELDQLKKWGILSEVRNEYTPSVNSTVVTIKTNVIADALSRVSYMEPPLKEDEVPLLEVNAITSTLPASPAKLEEIRQCTDQDVVLAHLKDIVHLGSQTNRNQVSATENWAHCGDIALPLAAV